MSALLEDALGAWLLQQRWFASKSRDVAGVHVVESAPARGRRGCGDRRSLRRGPLRRGDPRDYQLVLALDPAGEGTAPIAQVGDVTVADAFADLRAAAAIARLRGRGAGESPTAGVSFHLTDEMQRPSGGRDVRPMGADQSNTSLVFDSALVLKAFRRLEAGDNPELEMRFLTARGFPNIAALGGWYELQSDLMDATLGVVQRYIEGGRDGWELTLDQLASVPDGIPARLRELGAVIGAMHAALGSDATDPAFAPEEPSAEGLSLLTATIDEQIDVRPPARQRGAGADRRSRRGGSRATADALAPGRAAGSSATTATCTWARRCWPTWAGSSSTSRASPRARCASAGASACRCATSPGCCARSPTWPPRPSCNAA